MNLNIFKPAQAVESAFEKPNLAIALLLVLLPTIAFLAGLMLYGFDVLGFVVYEIVVAYVIFFILGLIVYATGIIFNGEKAKTQLLEVLSATALLQIVSLIFVILSFLTINLVFSPEAIEFATTAENLDQTGGFIAANPGSVNLIFFAISTIIAIALIALGIYILYKIIRKLTETRAFTSLILAAIILFILGIIPL